MRSVFIVSMMLGRRTAYASGAVTNLVVLGFAELHEQFCDLMLDLHPAQDGCSVIGDSNVSIRRDENLVQAARTKGSANDAGD